MSTDNKCDNGWNEQSWQNPPSLFRSAPFWSWNERLTPEKLTRQIEEMHQAGMGGFFMHSRYGLKTAYLSDEWFDCVNACVEKARQLGMKAYLYDEDRWPSGAAGGLVTRGHPEFSMCMLGVVKGEKLPPGSKPLGTFGVKLADDLRMTSYRAVEPGEKPSDGEEIVTFCEKICESIPWFNDAPYLNTFNPAAVREFIRVSHEAYEKRYAKDFGGVIPAIFTDEPNYFYFRGPTPDEGLIAKQPWTADFPREFKNRRGYDLLGALPELVFIQPDKPFSKVRQDYHRVATELFVEAFSAQIGQWCEKNHIAATGHYLAEQTLSSQVSVIGAAMPHYEYQQWPGIDILCDRRTEIGTVKQCTSVADQLGRERVLSELYGCTGWDWPLEGHKFNAAWQFVLGVNFRCPHLSWYSMAGGAKRDYPASIFPHSPWWKYYRTVEDYFGRLSLMLTQGKPVRDVLVLHPIESTWGLYIGTKDTPAMAEMQKSFDSLMVWLLDQHYDFDLGDESLLAKYGKVAGGKLSVGKMRYRMIVAPPMLTLRKSTLKLLGRFLDAGGQVLFAGPQPQMVDGKPSGELDELVSRAAACKFDEQALAGAMEKILPRRVSVTEQGRNAGFVWTMLRQVKGGQLLFVQSSDRKEAHTVRLSVQGSRPVVLWDAASGRRTRVAAEEVDGRVEFDLDLPSTGTALLSLGLSVKGVEPASKPAKVKKQVALPAPWPVELTEPNTFPLDYFRYRIGDGEFSPPVHSFVAETKIRGHFGLPERDNSGCQPWYLAQTGRFDSKPRGRCEMKTSFHVTDLPGKLQLAIERPGDYEILVNGQKISSAPVGCWIDEDVKVIDLAHVKAGENELLLRFDYHSDMEIEDLHLLGDFGVRQTGPKRTVGAFTLVAPPRTLCQGSWVGQGLDFYGGSVKVKLAVPQAIQEAVAGGKRVRLRLQGVQCTAAAIHAGGKMFVLPWSPMEAEISQALAGESEVTVEIIGGRHNILGPLHVPWLVGGTGPREFNPRNIQWTDEYLLNDHGLTESPVFEVLYK